MEKTKAERREEVAKRREELFRRNWKNERHVPQLKSRQQEKSFQFVVEWCEEFNEVISRERERERLDKLNFQARTARSGKEKEDGSGKE
ncbi:MAG: hypothetical protein LBU23_02585 [Planctomycetota bacterium]|nr:hypothetical protein [Planctomycetota bacterium]